MNQPTQEQIKEFWEWCGIKYLGDGRWLYPDGLIHWQGINTVDLNNLFKYAVPKLKVVTLTNGYKDWTATINQGELINGQVKVIGESYDPALALFWAIWEVIHSPTKKEERQK